MERLHIPGNLALWTLTFTLLLRQTHPQMTSVSRFQKIPAKNVFFNGAVADFESGTRRMCAIACSSTVQCLSFSFQPSSGRCRVYSRRVFYGDDTMTSGSGFQHYWKMKDDCPADEDFQIQAGNCVQVNNVREEWEDAQEKCVDYGGHLYIGETSEQMTALKTAISNFGYTTLDYRVGAFMETGGTGVWKWINGADVDTSLWENNQPGTVFTKRCSETVLHKPDKLNSDRCGQIDRYVCQIPLGFTAP